jgi:prepilin-type N-terminal cleavage/methylation domain-containing protein
MHTQGRQKMKRRGFTMIEVVVAVAIAAVLVIAIQMAVSSMTHTANVQKDAALRANQRQRFIEILRRDLRGWVEKSKDALPANPSSADNNVLFAFTTTSDPLIAGADATGIQRTTDVEYLTEKGAFGIELLRKESHLQGTTAVLPMLRISEAVTLEYYDGQKWTSQWQRKERPVLVRLTAGSLTALF